VFAERACHVLELPNIVCSLIAKQGSVGRVTRSEQVLHDSYTVMFDGGSAFIAAHTGVALVAGVVHFVTVLCPLHYLYGSVLCMLGEFCFGAMRTV
jgi:hypothetical protein